MHLSTCIASRCASDMLATGGWRIHMARITMRHRGYPFAVLETDTGFAAGGLQVPAMATAATMGELRKRLEEQVALHLLDCSLKGRDPEPSKAEDRLDLQDYREEGEEPDIVYAELARRTFEGGVGGSGLRALQLHHDAMMQTWRRSARR